MIRGDTRHDPSESVWRKAARGWADRSVEPYWFVKMIVDADFH